MKICYYNGNESTILLFNSIFRTTPEVSSKRCFIGISQVSEKLMLCNHRTADFLASKFWNLFSRLSLLNPGTRNGRNFLSTVLCSCLLEKPQPRCKSVRSTTENFFTEMQGSEINNREFLFRSLSTIGRQLLIYLSMLVTDLALSEYITFALQNVVRLPKV